MKLKSILILAFALPVIAFGNTCYEATSPVPKSVSSIFCVDSITETEIIGELIAKSSSGHFPSNLKIINYSRHNEERLNFTAQALLNEEWNTGCGEGFSSILNVKGQINYGVIDINNLTLSVEIRTTHDTCHSSTSLETISYKKL